MRYYKLTNKEECHRGFQYKDGINIDNIEFNPCLREARGLHFFSQKSN